MSKKQIVAKLKKEHAKIVLDKKNNPYYKQVYINLPITQLERKFFELYASSRKSDQTKTLRKFIQALMIRNPDIVEKAKFEIDKG